MSETGDYPLELTPTPALSALLVQSSTETTRYLSEAEECFCALHVEETLVGLFQRKHARDS